MLPHGRRMMFLKEMEWPEKRFSLWWFYLAAFAVFAVIWFPPAHEWHLVETLGESRHFESMPTMSAPALLRQTGKVQKLLSGPPENDIRGYMRALIKFHRIGEAQQKFEHDVRSVPVVFGVANPPTSEDVYRLRTMVPLGFGVEGLQSRYAEKFGQEAMARMLNESGTRERIDRRSPLRSAAQVDHSSSLALAWKAYFQTTILMLIVFVARLQQHGFMILVEAWRLPLVSLAWPGAFFLYPFRVNPKRQLRQALQFASFCLVTFLSFASMGSSKAEASEMEPGSSGRAKSAWIDPTVTVTTEAWSKYLVGIGKVVYDHPVSQTDVNVAFPNGWYLDVWGSTPTDGSGNFGREVDYTVGWASAHVDLGVSLFDLYPLASRKGSDIVQPYLRLGDSFTTGRGGTFSPYLKFQEAITTGDLGNSGEKIDLGVGHTLQLHPRFAITQTLQGSWVGPVFGSDTGLMGRYELGLRFKISEMITLSPIKIHVSTPLTPSIRDRTTEVAIGGGISMQFR